LGHEGGFQGQIYKKIDFLPKFGWNFSVYQLAAFYSAALETITIAGLINLPCKV